MAVWATISGTSASGADCLMPVAEAFSGMPRSREFLRVNPGQLSFDGATD